MHADLLPSPVPFSAPWDAEPLSERITQLLKGGGMRVAYLYERPDSSTFRYRVHNMVAALRSADVGISASWFALSEASELDRLMPQIDVLVIARVRYSKAAGRLISRARSMGVRLLFDCDDLVFDVDFAHMVTASLDQNSDTDEHWQAWFGWIGRTQTVASLCDGGITTNQFLAKKMGKIVKGPISVVPNYLNIQQQEISRKLLSAKQERSFKSSGPTLIGYFSGTPTHNLDFAIALPAILEIMRNDPNVRLRIVGFMDSFAALRELGSRIERIDLQDWLNLQVKIAEVDINIAPLQQNPFTECKSELKFFEAAVVGTWTCASNTFTFDKSITEERFGQKIENGDWVRALEEAITLVRDPSSYAERAAATAEYANSRYGWDRNTEAIVAALTSGGHRKEERDKADPLVNERP